MNKIFKPFTYFLFFGLSIMYASAQVPSLTSLAPVTSAQAGRIKITGQNFGSTQGTGSVKIGGVVAPVSSWTTTSITAYVPDASAIGVDQVQVITSGGSSNTLSLTVTARVSNGLVAWRFKADDMYIQGRPGIGPDGTIYALGINGHLYALTPEGGVKWIYNGYGSVQSVSVGHDGTIYFAGLNVVYALNPDGTLKWKVTDTSGGLVVAGPTVGPDGNIYAVTHEATDGFPPASLGAMSISPGGQILWNTPGFIIPDGGGEESQTKEIVFGSGQLYFCLNNYITSQFGLLALSMDNGDINWAQPGKGQPSMAPDGSIYIISSYLTSSYVEISSYDPDGDVIHTFFGNGTPSATYPDVGSDGDFYIGRNYSFLTGVEPNGDIKFEVNTANGNGILGGPIVNNSNSQVAVGGYSIGMPGYVMAVTPSGASQWTVNLPQENGGYVRPMSRPMYSPDDSRVYTGMDVNDYATNIYTYLYAINTGITGCVVPTVSISSGATSFCKGESLLLSSSVNGIVTYQWKKNNVNIAGATNATYSANESGNFSVAVVNSCGSATSNVLSVTANKKPAATISPSGTLSMCAGETTLLTANTGNNLAYQWKKNGTTISGATNNTFIAGAAGKYKVTVTNTQTGCEKNSPITTINVTCRVDSLNDIFEFEVFPNPSNHEFSLHFPDQTKYDIYVSDALGRILLTKLQVQGELDFGSDFETGMYFLTLYENGKPLKVVKLIKTI